MIIAFQKTIQARYWKPEIDHLLLQSASQFGKLFKNNTKNLFVVLLQRKCKFSENLLDALPDVYRRLQEDNDFDFQLVFYFCEIDGYCLKNFKTEGYPELRYYKKALDMGEGFVLHENPQKYNPEELYNFFKTRISGVTYTISKTQIEEIGDDLITFGKQYKKKLLYYCNDDFNKKELLYLNAAGKGYTHLQVIAFEDCQEEMEISNKFLKQFFEQRLKHKKVISMLKPRVNEVDYIWEDKLEEIEYKKVSHFVKYYRKHILQEVNDNLMNTLIVKKVPAIILFVTKDQIDLLREFKKVVYGNIKEKDITFSYFVKGLNKNSDYVGQFLQHKLGISQTDYPTLRALQFKNKKEVQRFMMNGEINEQFILSFYENFKKNELTTYQKSQLHELSIFEDLLSIIEPYNDNLFKGYIPNEKNTFLLIVEDENCEKSKKAIKEYEASILQILEKNELETSNLSFQHVSVLRADVEHLLPNEIPVLIFVPAQKKGIREFGSYFWIPSHFDLMIEYTQEGKDILDEEQFLNL